MEVPGEAPLEEDDLPRPALRVGADRLDSLDVADFVISYAERNFQPLILSGGILSSSISSLIRPAAISRRAITVGLSFSSGTSGSTPIAAHLPRPAGRDHHQLEAVVDVVEAVFDGDACHRMSWDRKADERASVVAGSGRFKGRAAGPRAARRAAAAALQGADAPLGRCIRDRPGRRRRRRSPPGSRSRGSAAISPRALSGALGGWPRASSSPRWPSSRVVRVCR